MKASTVRSVNCPSCGKAVEWTPESRYRPFCSERCKLIDLGAWATESFRLRAEETELNEEDLRSLGH
ncbi:DNA gyrase inhibitor YacG [Crenobacter cavernae]|uniref:DNA gyrase inhibitor YacG n=1 Tax=Crenobacter cavernae TaxID=2290923 RepID=A0A345Y391_9NEIS|nr:DNA gyrase inhibitor YacG [Crenobacter cavernae]AXK38393.1 DNA gyrase inhibitor YacG [Crenobacter cavernae]RXZ43559.1 DNA gyrase inhibitor YacG [Crenobacter cavernae]